MRYIKLAAGDYELSDEQARKLGVGEIPHLYFGGCSLLL